MAGVTNHGRLPRNEIEDRMGLLRTEYGWRFSPQFGWITSGYDHIAEMDGTLTDETEARLEVEKLWHQNKRRPPVPLAVKIIQMSRGRSR